MRRQKFNLTLVNAGLFLAVVSPLTPLYLPLLGVGLAVTAYAVLRLRRSQRRQMEADHGD